jgi:glycosyltransferase involved in cell wall biosynthesis
MKVVQVVDARLPALAYGGTERVVYWLGKGLVEAGHHVSFLCQAGSSAPFAECRQLLDGPQRWQRSLPAGTEMVHFHGGLPADFPKEIPHVVSIHGNGKAGELFPANSLFVSRNHAQRHGSKEFVYNGIDLAEYPTARPLERHRLLFLAKASWKVKNLTGALSIARLSGRAIDVIGGRRPWWKLSGLTATHARFHGMIGGATKLGLLANARALIFPVLWDEPFGLAVIEALACGAFVAATPWGSLPEIVSGDCGFLSDSAARLAEVCRKGSYDAQACRARVESRFTHIHMTEGYLDAYRRVLSVGRLSSELPRAPADAGPQLMHEMTT